jgi:hypothetical protein
MGVVRTYAPYAVWPFAFVIGVIGYNFETLTRGDKQTPWKTRSIGEERDLRKVEESKDKDLTQVDSLKAKTFVPKTIFERNK